MLVDSFEIKSGIKVHLIQNDIFKTNIALNSQRGCHYVLSDHSHGLHFMSQAA